MLLNKETVEVLGKLYESFEKEDFSLDEVCDHLLLNSKSDIVGNLKFVQDISRTGKLWLQFMDLVPIIRMFISATWTRSSELHISSLEQMLPYLAGAGYDKYTFAIRKYLEDIRNLCPCQGKKYKEGSFITWRNDKLFSSSTFTDQVIEQTLMQYGKSQGGLINITHSDTA